MHAVLLGNIGTDRPGHPGRRRRYAEVPSMRRAQVVGNAQTALGTWRPA